MPQYCTRHKSQIADAFLSDGLVVVQFSINSDGTFQYYANDMGWSTEMLFDKMYK